MESDKEVISRLKFIGKVQKGEKIDIQNFIVQPPCLRTKFIRTFLIQDNRLNTLNFIRSTVNKSFDVISDYINSEKEIKIYLCKNMTQDLVNSKQGIHNIKETYFNDVKFCCDIDVILENIDAFLISMKNEE